MTRKTSLATLIEGFFLQWMEEGRQLSSRTIDSYRDAFILFLRWLRDSLGIPAEKADVGDFNPDNVERFLLYLVQERGNSAATANCRLAAFKSFARYTAYRLPERLAQMKRVSDIPRRAEKRCEVCYLTREEVGWILECCSAETHLMISILFSTGARISELISLKVGDISFGDKGAQVRIFGKGRKERTLPLWPEVAQELMVHVESRSLANRDYIFPGRHVDHLTRSGARSRIDSAVTMATRKHAELEAKRVSAHVFRHSTVMAMLESGVDISTIAIWLGHEHIQTTHMYMVTDMKRKEAALAKAREAAPGLSASSRYKPSEDILDFLMSL